MKICWMVPSGIFKAEDTLHVIIPKSIDLVHTALFFNLQIYGKDWSQDEKGMIEDEVVRWHHWLNGHEFEQAPEVGDGQGSLACCSPWRHKSWTWLSNWTGLNWKKYDRNLSSMSGLMQSTNITMWKIQSYKQGHPDSKNIWEPCLSSRWDELTLD